MRMSLTALKVTRLNYWQKNQVSLVNQNRYTMEKERVNKRQTGRHKEKKRMKDRQTDIKEK
jgi:hypothetical protein